MADSPKEGEAAQALFCAIVDLKGTPFPSNIPNYLEFKQKYKREISIVRRKVVTPGVGQNGIEQLLLRDNDCLNANVVATGGYAKVFENDLKCINYIEEDLTLIGLNLTASN